MADKEAFDQDFEEKVQDFEEKVQGFANKVMSDLLFDMISHFGFSLEVRRLDMFGNYMEDRAFYDIKKPGGTKEQEWHFDGLEKAYWFMSGFSTANWYEPKIRGLKDG